MISKIISVFGLCCCALYSATGILADMAELVDALDSKSNQILFGASSILVIRKAAPFVRVSWQLPCTRFAFATTLRRGGPLTGDGSAPRVHRLGPVLECSPRGFVRGIWERRPVVTRHSQLNTPGIKKLEIRGRLTSDFKFLFDGLTPHPDWGFFRADGSMLYAKNTPSYFESLGTRDLLVYHVGSENRYVYKMSEYRYEGDFEVLHWISLNEVAGKYEALNKPVLLHKKLVAESDVYGSPRKVYLTVNRIMVRTNNCELIPAGPSADRWQMAHQRELDGVSEMGSQLPEIFVDVPLL